ncbi:hypothetical protein A33M_1182 [Rhodovulum sp. PH10]|nr:hypothetical protein A33M_1182 [Rhodovulum sp. PH10]
MPKETGLERRDVVLDLQTATSDVPSSRRDPVNDDRERGCNSRLFPVRRAFSDEPTERPSIGGSAGDSVQPDRKSNVGPRADDPPADGLFVPRSSRREP